MTLVIVGAVLFNVGFLVGVWWGSGWGRRDRDSLKAELEQVRRQQLQKTG